MNNIHIVYKNIFVYGLGITGQKVMQFLSKIPGISIFIYDDTKSELVESLLSNNIHKIDILNHSNPKFIDCAIISCSD